jgi:Uma2 family endonuclease
MSRASGRATGWTYSEYARLPDDGNRYEVIDGEVCVTPAPGPPHQIVAANTFTALHSYVREHGLGQVLWDVDLLFVSGQYLRPDMLFVPADRLDGITDRGVETAPGLVVEVLSPTHARSTRSRSRRATASSACRSIGSPIPSRAGSRCTASAGASSPGPSRSRRR